MAFRGNALKPRHSINPKASKAKPNKNEVAGSGDTNELESDVGLEAVPALAIVHSPTVAEAIKATTTSFMWFPPKFMNSVARPRAVRRRSHSAQGKILSRSGCDLLRDRASRKRHRHGKRNQEQQEDHRRSITASRQSRQWINTD